MVRAAALAALVTLHGACSDDPAPLEPAPLAEVCGAAGTFQLLSLAPDERVGSYPNNFAVVGDRLLFIAGKGERGVSSVYGPFPATSTVYAVGPCGEAPVVVAHDVDELRQEPLWPGVALGCTMTGNDLVRLDPSGSIEPVLLAPGACSATVTKHGLLFEIYTDDGRVSADFLPLIDPAGPSFGDAIRIADPVIDGEVQSLPDEVLFLEASRDLVSFALPDLTRTVLQPDVVAFAASEDSRYLLYQLAPNSGDDPSNPNGTIHIRDRSNGLDVPIGTGWLGGGNFPYFFALDLTRVTLSSPTDHDRLISLPDFQFLDAPEAHELRARLPDGRWLSRSEYGNGPWHVIDHEAGQATMVRDARGKLLAYSADHIDLLQNGYTSTGTTARLVRYFFDDREPQTLARRAHPNAIFREDGRILTMTDTDENWIGELTLVDTSSQEARHIDDHVVAADNLARWVHPTEPDTLVYSIVDGDRTGVWLARPTPLE